MTKAQEHRHNSNPLFDHVLHALNCVCVFDKQSETCIWSGRLHFKADDAGVRHNIQCILIPDTWTVEPQAASTQFRHDNMTWRNPDLILDLCFHAVKCVTRTDMQTHPCTSLRLNKNLQIQMMQAICPTTSWRARAFTCLCGPDGKSIQLLFIILN